VTPGLGVEGTSSLPAGHWLTSVAFRFYHSYQDVSGSQVLSEPLVYANTHVYALDFAATYAVTDRFDLSLDLPFQYGTRKTWVEHDYMSLTLHTMQAAGFGNLRLTADYWLFDPATHPARNISLALGVEIPSGKDDATDYSYRATGKVLRPVDPAIQPANGGWGIILSAHAFSSLYFPRWTFTDLFKNTFAYADAIYVFTPQEMSDTQSVFGDQPALTGGDKGLMFDSIPDQFLARAGLSQVIWPKQGVSVSAGVRWEGVPAFDVIGGSNGWRIPGSAVSFEPTISLTRGKEYFSVSVPFALYRVAYKNEPATRLHDPSPGLATIAGWQLVVSYTHQF
jgi:hypothetical protein